jgi:hypothetical protein
MKGIADSCESRYRYRVLLGVGEGFSGATVQRPSVCKTCKRASLLDGRYVFLSVQAGTGFRGRFVHHFSELDSWLELGGLEHTLVAVRLGPLSETDPIVHRVTILPSRP